MPVPVRPSRAIATIAAGVVLTSLAVAPPALAAPPVGTVTGTVVDDTGTPVARLVVSARTGANAVLATTRTAADGTYRLTAPAGARAVCFDGTGVVTTSGGYAFTCFGGPTADTATVVRVTAGQVRSGVDGTVTRRALIRGRVTDSAGPVAGVGVRLGRFDPVRTFTDADGRYRQAFDPAAMPSAQICFEGSTGTGGASQAGYLDVCSDSVALAPGSVAVVAKTLAPAAGAAGRVTDSLGQPIAGARVSINAADDNAPAVSTGANGTWRALGLRPGPTLITITPLPDAEGPNASGLLPACQDGSPVDDLTQNCTAAPPVTLVAGHVRTGIRTTLPDGAELSGRLTDNLGVPIPGVSMSVDGDRFGNDNSVVTAADGTWRLRGLRPDVYTVCAGDRGYIAVHAPDPDGYSSACVSDGTSYAAKFTLVTDDRITTRQLELTGRGRVIGRVVDAVTGRGIGGVDVAISNGPYPTHVVTAADGTYVLGELDAGEHGICALPFDAGDHPPLGYAGSCPPQYTEFLRDPQLFLVQDRGDTTGPTLALVQNATVGGRVTDRAGFPLRGVSVIVTDPASEDTLATVETGADGRWVSYPFKPTTVTVCFHGANAVRSNDGTHPAGGYADRCWNGGAQPTPVTVSPGEQRTGIDAVLLPSPAG